MLKRAPWGAGGYLRGGAWSGSTGEEAWQMNYIQMKMQEKEAT